MRYFLTILAIISSSATFSQDSVKVEKTDFKVGDTIHIDEIRFPLGEDRIGYYSDDINRPIDSIIHILKVNPSMKIRIESHTDTRGSDDKNRELSQNRAERISDMIVSNGIDSTRIKSVGHGEDQPVFEEEYINQFRKTDRKKFERLHQRNRRTIFIVTTI